MQLLLLSGGDSPGVTEAPPTPHSPTLLEMKGGSLGLGHPGDTSASPFLYLFDAWVSVEAYQGVITVTENQMCVYVLSLFAYQSARICKDGPQSSEARSSSIVLPVTIYFRKVSLLK